MVEVEMAPEEMWRAYVASRDPTLRERLLLQYIGLVKYVVGRLSVNLPNGVDRDDLVSCGTLGLIDAVDRFDPARGVKFECYAITRIRGSIIDHLRAQGMVTRSSVRAARILEEALAALGNELGRMPTEREIADRLGVEPAELHQRLTDVAPVVVSLDSALAGEDGETASLAETIADPSSPNPVAIAENHETVMSLAEAIGQLPKRERLVVSLYYHDALTMKEISLVLGVSESRVSQLHTQEVLRLRAWLRRKTRGMYAVA